MALAMEVEVAQARCACVTRHQSQQRCLWWLLLWQQSSSWERLLHCHRLVSSPTLRQAQLQGLGSLGSAAFGSACPFNEQLVLSAVEIKPWCAAPRATILEAAWFHAFLEVAGSLFGGSA